MTHSPKMDFCLRTRRNTYLACEELDFSWDLAEVREVEDMWNAGIPIDWIARNFDRKPIEVALLIMDRAERGHIEPREGGVYGKQH